MAGMSLFTYVSLSLRLVNIAAVFYLLIAANPLLEAGISLIASVCLSATKHSVSSGPTWSFAVPLLGSGGACRLDPARRMCSERSCKDHRIDDSVRLACLR